MLLEIAIGDAYGAGFEFRPRGPEFVNDLSGYIKHPLHDMPPGSYTDDTEMSIAVARAMILSGGRLNRQVLADCFVSQFRTSLRLGYARRFRDFLLTVKDADDFLARMQPTSNRSGAAMRACPIGLYPDEETVMEMAEMQARITHDTQEGVEGAQAAALATHYFRFERGPKERLHEYLAQALGPYWLKDHEGAVGETGPEVVRAAVTAIRRSMSLSDVLRISVDFTGDVDSVAAIAMGAASFCASIARDVPSALVTGLENGEWGRDRIVSLDRTLLETKWPTHPEPRSP